MGWSRWWFAMGAGREGTIQRVADKCGLTAGESESLFMVMMKKVSEEVYELRRNFAAYSEALFRTIKCDQSADWGARQRAQIDLENLLDLPAYVHTTESPLAEELHESLVFHQTLIDSADSTAPDPAHGGQRYSRDARPAYRNTVRTVEPESRIKSR